MWAEGQTADGAALERLSGRLIQDYATRCAARAEVRDQECGGEREWNLEADEVYSWAIPDGTLAKVRRGSSWTLWLEWKEGYGMRVLTHGSREHVERYALDVAVHGPPGGPELRTQGSAWRCIGGDETLRSLTSGGELRLMPLRDGRQVLMFARNDFGLYVLGIGEPEELQRTAHERLRNFRGDVLRVGIGNERIPLRGVGAAGALGHVEMFDGARLMLGHLAGDYFGLLFVRGEIHEWVGIYNFTTLRQGDLGQVLGWTQYDRGDQSGETDTLGVQREHPPDARPGAAAPQKPKRPSRVARLTAADLQLIDRHLTLDRPATGPGATMVPNLLAGIRAMARLGLGNQLMRGCDLQRLLKARFGIEFHCCSKTFGRAIAAVATHTRLLSRVGKRWLLRFGDLLLVDSELRHWIAMGTPGEGAAPLAAATPAAGVTQESHPKGSEGRGEQPANSVHGLIRNAGEPWPTSETTPEVDTANAEPLVHGKPSDPDGEVGDLPDLPWLVSKGHQRRHPQHRRRDGPLRVTLVSVPIEESASQWRPRKKSRGPP